MIFYDMYNNDKFKEVEYADGTDWEKIVCPKVDDHQRAGNRIGQLQINIKSKKIGDFLWTFLSELIVNEKFINILKDNKITGYNLNEVKVNNMNLPYTLWEFNVVGNGGEAHNDSGIYLKEKCDYCDKKKYSAYENGIIIDENNWDGSDIFTAVGYPRHILITEKVKELIEKNKLTGVKLTPSHELKWPENINKP